MRWKLGLSLVTVAAVVAFAVWLYRRPTPASAERFPLPAFSDSPYLNTGPEAQYIGIAACKECHPPKYRSYLHTAHSRALSEVNAAAEPPGSFEHKLSGRSYRAERRGERFHLREALHTPEGKEIAALDFPVRYLIGSGHTNRVYLIEDGDFLVESPISWYRQKQHWFMSPGFDGKEHPGFERTVTTECLVCHAGRVERKPDVSEGVNILEQVIGCESCHGPGSLHAEHQRGKKHPPGEDDLTIVNPGKLSRDRLESLCALCHLQGLSWADVRGRKIIDYRPGRPITDYRIHYAASASGERFQGVGHLEQLRQSVCYQKDPSLSCLTCHNPHLSRPPQDPVAYYRQKCLNCHETRGCKVEKGQRLSKSPADDCTACHMPRGDSEMPHIAFTHHRIGRHSKSTPAPQHEPTGLVDLVPIQNAPQLGEVDQQRNLGLAYLLLAFKVPDQQHAFIYGRRARGLLEGVYQAGLRDGPVLQSLAQIYRREGNLPQARAFAQDALARTDLQPEVYGELLSFVAEGHILDEEPELALPILEKLTRARRVAADWRNLGLCYFKLNQTDRAVEALEKSLRINPYNPRGHAQLAAIYRKQGDLSRAREYEEKARRLDRGAQ